MFVINNGFVFKKQGAFNFDMQEGVSMIWGRYGWILLSQALLATTEAKEGCVFSICSLNIRKVYIVLNIFIKFLYEQVGSLLEAVIQAHTAVPGPDNAGRGQKPRVVAIR